MVTLIQEEGLWWLCNVVLCIISYVNATPRVNGILGYNGTFRELRVNIIFKHELNGVNVTFSEVRVISGLRQVS